MSEADDLWKFLENPRHLIVFILWGLGFFCKQTPEDYIKNWWIPWILAVIGPILSVAVTLSQTNFVEIFSPTKIIQITVYGSIWGLAYAIFAVFTHDRLKNFLEKRREDKESKEVS